MPLQSSGAIDVKNIEGEFDGAGSVTPDPIFDIKYYYRNGPFVSSNNTNIPTSGPISFANFYGASNNDVVVIISSNTTNVNAQTLFGANWTNAAVRKRLIISPNVIVGGVHPSPALTIPSGLANNLYIINYGSIQGYGGEGSTYKIISGTNTVTNYGYVVQNGGNAISVSSSNVYILNYGTIYAGGGGGGTPTTQTATTQTILSSAKISTVANIILSLSKVIRDAGGTGVGYNQTNNSPLLRNRYSVIFTNNAFYQNFNFIFPPNFDISITNGGSYTRKMFFSSNSSITLNQNSAGIGQINSAGCTDRGNGATTLDSPGATIDNCVFAAGVYTIGGVQISGTDSVFRWNGSSSGFRLLIKDPSQPHYAGGVLNAGGTLANNTIYSLYTTSGLQNQSNTMSLNGAWGTSGYSYSAVPTDGYGGTGGTGGNWGQPGTGSGAGLGGSYIVGNSNVNWVNLGTVIGSVG
jgi:hypothetical protein